MNNNGMIFWKNMELGILIKHFLFVMPQKALIRWNCIFWGICFIIRGKNNLSVYLKKLEIELSKLISSFSISVFSRKNYTVCLQKCYFGSLENWCANDWWSTSTSDKSNRPTDIWSKAPNSETKFSCWIAQQSKNYASESKYPANRYWLMNWIPIIKLI